MMAAQSLATDFDNNAYDNEKLADQDGVVDTVVNGLGLNGDVDGHRDDDDDRGGLDDNFGGGFGGDANGVGDDVGVGGGGGGNLNYSQNSKPLQKFHNDFDEDMTNQPHYMTGFMRGKPCSYYVNGDRHFVAKKIVVNPKHFKDMSHYMDHLTDKLNPAFGAIRKIHTPHHGTRVYNMNELKPGETYVAAGNERFRRIGYDQIVSSERKKSPPFKYDANPVVHSRVFQCSGKIKKIENSSIIIKVWPNGGEKRTRRPRVVLLRRTAGWNISTVISIVNDMLKDDCNGPVESLYSRSGLKLADVDSLEHNGVYVALTKRDRFKRASYPDFATKDLHTSPRPDRKMLDPLYSRSNNSTSNSSPEHSNASSSQGGVPVNGQPRRRPPPRREEDQVFPAKPVKHNRSFDRAKKVDLDKDEGGVFKAKNSNSHTRGAREINDTRQTKVDLPLDQQRAREVDEDIPDRSKDDPYSPYSRQPEQQQQQRGYPEAKANSRRNPPPRAAPAPAKKEVQKRKGLLIDDDDDEEEDFRNNDDVNREESVIKIQAGYRGYKARKDLSNQRNVGAAGQQSRRSKSPRSPPPKTASPRQPSSANDMRVNSISPQNLRNATPPQKSPSPPPAYDFREEEAAATKIQAGYRGHKARKQLQVEKTAKDEADKGKNQLEDYQSIAKEEANKLVDNASDRYGEEEAAATKIQAGFRGHVARRELKAQQAQKDVQELNNNLDNDVRKAEEEAKSAANKFDDDDEDEEDDYDKAATKIQAGYRGFKARKNLRLGNF